MNDRRIDEFFKSKLGNAEIQPNISANGKFLAQLEKRKKGFTWWKVAASIAILGVATWLFLSPNEISKTVEIGKSLETEAASTSPELIKTDGVDNLAQITDVAPEVDMQEQVPLITKEIEPDVEIVAHVQVAVNKATIPKEKMTENFVPEQKIEDTIIIPTLEELPDLSNELQVASNEQIVDGKELPAVRITYISGKKKRQMTETMAKTDTSKVSPLNRIFIGAISLADGSLIAGLRDAKEDFFNRKND
ncbi:MAG: hypothetical protein O2887_17010 [Bacteroidetes bacterium]|nr:hypothetical protein [Bacteroidota bacterium]MDA1122161.1 hypothetical protein [Bacteroidota bacterium]